MSTAHRTSKYPKAHVVVVGGINIDLTIMTPTLPRPGETVSDGVLHTDFGGKGANQAVAAKRAGADVTLASAVGMDDNGDRYVEHLRSEGIDVESICRLRNVATGTALICVDAQGRNQISVAPGANQRLRPSHVKSILASLGPGDVVVAPLEVPMDTVSAAMRQARRRGATTLLNPAPFFPISDALVDLIDVVVMNEVEAQMLCELSVGSVASAHKASALAQAKGFSSVVITLGERGAVWRVGKHRGHTSAPRVKAVDTVGAGDTFVGYLASELSIGKALAQSIPLAVHAATHAVTRHGAQSAIPERRKVRIPR